MYEGPEMPRLESHAVGNSIFDILLKDGIKEILLLLNSEMPVVSE